MSLPREEEVDTAAAPAPAPAPKRDAFAALMGGAKRKGDEKRRRSEAPLPAPKPSGRVPKDHKTRPKVSTTGKVTYARPRAARPAAAARRARSCTAACASSAARPPAPTRRGTRSRRAAVASAPRPCASTPCTTTRRTWRSPASPPRCPRPTRTSRPRRRGRVDRHRHRTPPFTTYRHHCGARPARNGIIVRDSCGPA